MAVKKKFPYRSALVACNGGCHVQEGQSCENGCIGCGICVSVCPFQAIVINENGVAQVDEAKCVACGKCVRECPKQVIHIHECANYIVVRCSNRQNGKEARQVCLASCIGCGICTSRCPAGISHPMVGLLARRLTGKYIEPESKHLTKRVEEIHEGKYDALIEQIMQKPIAEMEELYNTREIEK